MPSDSRGNEHNGELVRLLCRALSRLAVAAHGIDRRLDDMLAELRQLLRRDIEEPAQLSMLVDAIDARIKVVDDERDNRGDSVQQSLQQLVGQLLATKPSADIARELKNLQKEFKRKPADGEELRLLARLPALQAQVLAGDPAAPRSGLFSRLFGRDQEVPSAALADAGDSAMSAEPREHAAVAEPERAAAFEPVSLGASTLNTLQGPDEQAAGDQGGDPPFNRISSAVCQVLDRMLQQIDPPPSASDNYRHARDQIARGLNWYELVSTLEEISVIVLAALEGGQGEFQEFLVGINQRLQAAHSALASSKEHQTQRRESDTNLNQTVRAEVAQMQVRMAEATQFEQLKIEIGARLDVIVGALDQHKEAEQHRQLELEQQLGTLAERLLEMETQSSAIEQRMLEQQKLALLDTLTQLPNRQAYEQQLQHEYERWVRYGRPLALAVCDVDHFKSINDNFGHLAGDKVLRIIAKTLRTRLRKTDFIARFGGEEFVILMPETELPEALQVLETIREAVATCPFHFRDQPVVITVSAGVAAFVADAPPEKIFERADAALYQAKQAGRNRCISATG